MDYLALSERYAVWLLDEVPPLATVGPAAQQRFINVIDVLYEKQIRLLLVTRCDPETLVAGVELEDIQRTRSRLQQLPRAVKTPGGCRGEDHRSKRSRFITLVRAATKSCTSFCCPSAQA